MSSAKHARIIEALKDQPRISQVPRYTCHDKEDFLEQVGRLAYPAILETKRSPTSRVQPDQVIPYLLSQHNDLMCQVRVGDYADPKIYSHQRQYDNLSLSDYIKRCVAGNLPEIGYAGRISFPEITIQKIAGEIPSFLSSDELFECFAWLGPASAITPLHKDSSDNFVIQVLGVKAWTLYPVRDIPLLDMHCPTPTDAPDFYISRIDLRRPQLEEMCAFLKAKSVSVLTCPGDILYIPAGWVHYVNCVQFSLTVNYWRKPELPPFLFC